MRVIQRETSLHGRVAWLSELRIVWPTGNEQVYRNVQTLGHVERIEVKVTFDG